MIRMYALYDWTGVYFWYVWYDWYKALRSAGDARRPLCTLAQE